MSGIIANTSDVSWVAESGDCINRQDAINVAIQAADDWDGGYNPERAEMIERGLKMIPTLQAEPCEDAISRADVKKYLSAPDANGDRVIYESDLDLLPSVTPKAEPKWIPCTERLPEERMNCLITVEVTPYACNSSYEVHTAWFDGRNFIDKTYVRVAKRSVIAWQPLPEAYTESEEEESYGYR